MWIITALNVNQATHLRPMLSQDDTPALLYVIKKDVRNATPSTLEYALVLATLATTTPRALALVTVRNR